MDEVKVTYLVGKESVCCPDAAMALAKKSGEKVVQLVAGQKCGGCSSTTRLNLAHAKFKAAVEALLAADKKNSESGADGTSANDTGKRSPKSAHLDRSRDLAKLETPGFGRAFFVLTVRSRTRSFDRG